MSQVLEPSDVLKIRAMYRKYIEKSDYNFDVNSKSFLGNITLSKLSPKLSEVYVIANRTIILIKGAEYRPGYGNDLLVNLRGELINE